MKLISIDFSITSPAITLWDDISDNYTFICFDDKNVGMDTIQNDKYRFVVLETYMHQNDLLRFVKSQDLIINAIKKVDKDFIKDAVVCIEGYSFGGNGQLTRIAEACVLLKYNLYLNGASSDIIQYSPMTIKKYATGKGNSKKEQMIEAYKDKTEIDLFDLFDKKRNLKTIPAPVTDIVDSFWIMELHKSKVFYDLL